MTNVGPGDNTDVIPATDEAEGANTCTVALASSTSGSDFLHSKFRANNGLNRLYIDNNIRDDYTTRPRLTDWNGH